MQNIVSCRFKLMPFGFFARNPAIDMADTARHGGGHCAADIDATVSGGGGGGGGQQ